MYRKFLYKNNLQTHQNNCQQFSQQLETTQHREHYELSTEITYQFPFPFLSRRFDQSEITRDSLIPSY